MEIPKVDVGAVFVLALINIEGSGGKVFGGDGVDAVIDRTLRGGSDDPFLVGVSLVSQIRIPLPLAGSF